MEKYDELNGKIVEFLGRDEVVEDEETISAYNLFMLMASKFNELVYAYEYAPKKIKEKANDALRSKYGSSAKRFKKKTDDVQFYSKVFAYCDLNKRQMNMLFYNADDISTRISKDVGETNLYYGRGERVDDCVIDTCIDEIYTAFGILEEFYALFRDANVLETLEKNYNGVSQEFSFGEFKYRLTYNKNGYVGSNLFFSKDIDPNGVQSRCWYGDRLSIGDIIEEYGDELLKRFPIKVSELDKVSQAIVKDYLKYKEKQKQKTM